MTGIHRFWGFCVVAHTPVVSVFRYFFPNTCIILSIFFLINLTNKHTHLLSPSFLSFPYNMFDDSSTARLKNLTHKIKPFHFNPFCVYAEDVKAWCMRLSSNATHHHNHDDDDDDDGHTRKQERKTLPNALFAWKRSWSKLQQFPPKLLHH